MKNITKQLQATIPPLIVSVFALINSNSKLHGEDLVVEHYAQIGVTKCIKIVKPVLLRLARTRPALRKTGNKRRPRNFELWVLRKQLI